MPKFLNWSLVTVLITMAGVVVPIWIWRADLTAKSLEFRVASQASLEPAKSGDIKGLQITLGSTPLDRPYLTVVELLNDGSKPIPSSEFEGPVEVRLSGITKIVRAELVSVNPTSLEAKISASEHSISIAPLLLNPEDKLTISVLTSGGPPSFSPRARIVGVTEIKFDDSQGKSHAWKLSGAALLFAFLLFVASDITNHAFSAGNPVMLRKRAAVLVSSVTGMIGSGLFFIFLWSVGVHSWWQILLAFILLWFVTGIVATLWNYWPNKSKASSHNAS